MSYKSFRAKISNPHSFRMVRVRSRPERSSSREGRKRLQSKTKTMGVVRVPSGPAADHAAVGRTGLLKLCVTKLARINDPESKLCRAVLINNTLRKCQANQQTCSHDEEQLEVEEEEEEVDTQSVEEVKREGEVLVERMRLCQDLMEDYLDLINSSEKSSDEICDSNRTFEDVSSAAGLTEFVSPYSYNSFLSEVYEQSISRILKKVDK